MRRFACLALQLTVLLLTLSLLPARAQEPGVELPRTSSTSEHELKEELLFLQEETVSIASRYDQPISEAPSNVYVITDEDIGRSGATDIPTILRRIPGMEVVQMTGADFNVSVRGDVQPQANKLLLMVDGRPIYIDVSGQVFWKLLPVTLPEIKRIEVLKGPASAVYGFNAFDGIINIITKSPGEMKGTTVQLGGGQLGTLMASAVNAGGQEKFGYRLSVGWNQNQQWRDKHALAFRDYLVNAHTEYAIRPESKLTVDGGFVDANRFDGPLSQDATVASQPSQGYAQIVYEQPHFLVRGFWTHNDIFIPQQSFAPAIAPFLQILDLQGNPSVQFISDTFNLDIQQSLNLSKNNLLTTGATYRNNHASSNILTRFTNENRLGLFVQDEWTVIPTFTVVGGVRYDMDSFIEPTISPRVALLYSPVEQHTLRASISVAYAAPTISQRSIDEQVQTRPPLPPSTTFIKGGLTPLAPEQIISYDLGYQGWYFNHRLRVRADAFFNHISDLISSSVNLSPNLSVPINNNGSADIFGGEAGVEYLATTWLSGFANYSYQEITQSITGRGQRAGPRNKFNVGLRGNWSNGLSAEALLYYYGSVTYPPGQSSTSLANAGLIPAPNQHVDSYTLLNLRSGYRFWQQQASAGYRREAEVAVSVFNALNDEHREYPQGDTIGRIVMGWLTVRY